jgi:enoyl-CoA hydratase
MIRLAKESLNGIEDGNLEDKYRWEQGFTLQAYQATDSAETRRAFVEKRSASFVGAPHGRDRASPKKKRR